MIFLIAYLGFYLSSRAHYLYMYPSSEDKALILIPGIVEIAMLYSAALEAKYQFDIMYELAKILIKGY